MLRVSLVAEACLPEGTEIIARLVVIVMIAFLAAPSAARGDVRSFTPRFYGFEGELDFNASHENSRNTALGRGLRTSNTYFSENIVLTTSGFVYHPRFLLFLAKLGAGLSQESFKSNVETDSGGWRNAFLSEYQFRALLLPEHPYNLELFALRMNPFIPGRMTWGVQPVSTSEGAMFTYKQQPVMFRTDYTRSSTESSASTTDTDTFNTSAGYTVENFSLAGSYSHSESKNTTGSSGGSEITGDQYSLQNQLRYFENKFILVSDVSWNINDARNATTSLNSDRFAWTEGLNLSLPREFDARLSYNHFDDKEKSLEAASGVETRTTSKNDFTGLSITKKLYESVSAGYNYGHSAAKTTTGDFTNATHAVNGTYTKKIPGGRLTAGGFFAKSRTNQNGAPVVSNEIHPAGIFPATLPVVDQFQLNGVGIDETRITILAVNPSTTAFGYLAGSDYLVLHVGNTLWIRILGVPSGVRDPDPAFVYEFRVTYYLVPESTETETTDTGYNLKLELFGEFFNPYYGYSHRTQKLLSGTVPGGPDEATTKTVGVLFQKAPYYLMLEHQENRSTVNPSKQDRAEAIYRKDLTPTTNVNGRAFYSKVKNLESPSQPVASEETGTGGDVSIRQTFPRRNLTLNATGMYQRRKSTFETKTLSMTTDLTWRIGLLDLGLGAVAGRTDTGLDTGSQESMYQRYYLFFKRKLF